MLTALPSIGPITHIPVLIPLYPTLLHQVILGLSEIGPTAPPTAPSGLKWTDAGAKKPDATSATEKIFKLVKVKDRFTTDQKDGYRDICLNVEVAWVSEMDSNRQVSDIIYMYLIWIFAI